MSRAPVDGLGQNPGKVARELGFHEFGPRRQHWRSEDLLDAAVAAYWARRDQRLRVRGAA